MRGELELVHDKPKDIFPSRLSATNDKAVRASVFCFRRPSLGCSSGSMFRYKLV